MTRPGLVHLQAASGSGTPLPLYEVPGFTTVDFPVYMRAGSSGHVLG